jgi:predicted nucleotidyltransferase
MTPDETRAHIAARLAAAASEEGVRILYAAESGSRAWGFPSPDSDFDVRFLYAHGRDWYVSLAEERDVIERSLVIGNEG